MEMFRGVVEVDESYFGAVRKRGDPGSRVRGRGASKQPVFGVIERGGEVFTEIIPDAKKKTLQDLIRGKVALDATIMSDAYRSYHGLVDVGYDRHLRLKKYYSDRTWFADGEVHINGIEAFWSFAKRRSQSSTEPRKTSSSTSRNANGAGVRTPLLSKRNSGDC